MRRVQETRMTTPRKLVGISLFSGAGGMDIGAIQAGVEVVACVELDPNACNTLRQNHERLGLETRVFEGSILNYPPKLVALETGMGPGEIDLIFGGPPCQSFSQIGKQESILDPRGLLIFQMVKYAKFFRPHTVVVENVKGLVSAVDSTGRRGGVLDALVRDFKRLGYRVEWRVLNSADYGVPQKRQRLFIVATLGRKATFPEPTHFPDGDSETFLWSVPSYVTVGEAIKGLRRPSPKNSKRKDSHVDVTPAGDIRRITGVPEGSFLAGCLDLPLEQRGRLTKKDTTKFLRLGRDKQANTLRCGEIFFHPTENRYLTPREYMRLHGYPDDYVLVGPIRGRSGQVRVLDQHRLVANSVPPPLAAAVICAAVSESILTRQDSVA